MRVMISYGDGEHNIDLSTSHFHFTSQNRTEVVTVGGQVMEFETNDELKRLVDSITSLSIPVNGLSLRPVSSRKAKSTKKPKDKRVSFLIDDHRLVWLEDIHRNTSHLRIAVTMKHVVKYALSNMTLRDIATLSGNLSLDTDGWESRQYYIDAATASTYKSKKDIWVEQYRPHQIVNAMIRFYADNHQVPLTGLGKG